MTTFSLIAPENAADPYPLYRRLREEAPVYRDETLGGVWLVTRYADVAALLSEQEGAALTAAALPTPAAATVPGLLLFADPPTHGRIQAGILSALKARTAKIEPRIRELADTLIERAVTGSADKRSFDFVSAVADPLARTVVTELVGLPVADADLPTFGQRVFDFTLVTSHAPIPPEAGAGVIANVEAFLEQVRTAFRQRQTEPADDLLTDLVNAGLSEDEAVVNATLVIVGGYAPAASLLANGLIALTAEQPAAWQRLLAEPGLLENGSAVNELLRYEPSLHWVRRRTVAPITVSGVTIPAGEVVLFGLASANRDPERFADPDTLDLGRADNDHLGLGYGPHGCLGAALAWAEAKAVLAALRERLPSARVEAEGVVRVGAPIFRGVAAANTVF